jgi:hypothetical protein
MEYAYERRALIVVFITAIRDYKQEESTGKKYTVMNRVEASIAAKKTDRIVSALEDLNLQATSYESKGIGNGGRKYGLSYAYSI